MQRIVWVVRPLFRGHRALLAIQPVERQPHALLDAESRRKKAQKIEVIVGRRIRLEGTRVLDIGTGSGFISASFRDVVGPEGEVWAVDTIDQRQVTEGFRFRRVTDARLPFDDDFFDVVISNHAVEHVGEREDQLQHIKEMGRVLKKDGIAYLAAPNRWAPIEPHFRLPFLSWLPPALRPAYLRAAGRGGRYDCSPLSFAELTALLRGAGLKFTDATPEAMRVMARVEESHPVARWLLTSPAWLVRLARPVVPTMVFLLKKV